MASSGSDLLWEPTPAPTHGTIGDANTMRISPDYLGMAQDVVLDTSGVLRNRGGTITVTSDTFASLVPQVGMPTATGTGLITNDASANVLMYGTSVAALTGFALLTSCYYGGNASIYPGNRTFTFAKFSDNKGAVLAGDLPFINAGTSPNVASMWGGNVVTTSDTTAGTAASTIGSKAIAGAGTSWTTALIGTYLFIGAGTAANYVGRVAAVGSTTTITLEKGALKTIAAAAPAFKTVRSTQFNVYKGRITTNTASAVVVGSNTKFQTSGPAGSGSVLLTNTTSNLFRYSDGAFIGAVTSVQNDTTLTLTGNAAIAMVNEEYYLSNPTFTIASPGPVFLFQASSTARFADRFWYGGISATDPSVSATNTATTLIMNMPNAVAFSKKNDPECLDLDPSAGDYLTLPTGVNNDRIRGLCATRGGLVVFRTHDTYLITGYSPETFRAIKIVDDGIPMSISFREYREGVVWPGFKSVWYFDGTKVVDLLQSTVRNFYQRSNAPIDANSPCTVATSNDHVMVAYPMNLATDRTWPLKNSTNNINYVVLVVNMLNGAITFFTNMYPTSSFYSDALNTSVILARTNAGLSNATGYLLSGNILFLDNSTAANNFDTAVPTSQTITGQGTVGPNVMFETTKYVMGDATRLKTWKRCLVNYSSAVSMTAAVIGTNDTTLDFPNRTAGTASSDVLAVSSNAGILHRMRFLVRSPQLVIRVYQTNAASATSQRFKMFWWAVGSKRMRQGRVEA